MTTSFWYLGSRRTDPSRNLPVNSILAPVPSGNRFSGNREIGVLETCGPEPLRTMAPKDGSIRLDPNIFFSVNFPPGILGSQDPGIPGSRDPGILHPALGTSMHRPGPMGQGPPQPGPGPNQPFLGGWGGTKSFGTRAFSDRVESLFPVKHTCAQGRMQTPGHRPPQPPKSPKQNCF